MKKNLILFISLLMIAPVFANNITYDFVNNQGTNLFAYGSDDSWYNYSCSDSPPPSLGSCENFDMTGEIGLDASNDYNWAYIYEMNGYSMFTLKTHIDESIPSNKIDQIKITWEGHPDQMSVNFYIYNYVTSNFFSCAPQLFSTSDTTVICDSLGSFPFNPIEVVNSSGDMIFKVHGWTNEKGMTIDYVKVDIVYNDNYKPYDTIILPNITSNITLDKEGLERTYLYCSWRIDGIGEEVVMMNSEICPETEKTFQLINDEEYYARIDYAKILFNGSIGDWQLVETGIAGEINRTYKVDIPEPSLFFLQSIIDTIWNYVKSVLCGLFPGLGFCS